MKKFILCLLTAGLLLTFIPAQLDARSKPLPTTTKPVESEEVKAIINRLNEIKAMDKSKLTRSEKKVLRKEVTESKKKMESASGGVYISVGVLILIIILLVILL